MKILFAHRHPSQTDSQMRHIRSAVYIIEECVAKAIGSSFEIVICDQIQIKDYLFDPENPSEFSPHNKIVSWITNDLSSVLKWLTSLLWREIREHFLGSQRWKVSDCCSRCANLQISHFMQVALEYSFWLTFAQLATEKCPLSMAEKREVTWSQCLSTMPKSTALMRFS